MIAQSANTLQDLNIQSLKYNIYRNLLYETINV